MLFNTKFDLVFGIGEACSCTQILRKCHLQFYSYPFDWVYGSDILTRIKILASDFKEFIRKEDLVDLQTTNGDKKNLCEIYKNTINEIHFNHDFEYGKSLDETYEAIKTKYNRRSKRLISQIEQSNKVLILYLQASHNKELIEKDRLIEAYSLLKNRFPDQEIVLLNLYCDHNIKKPNLTQVAQNIFKINFDYDKYDKKRPYEVNRQLLQKALCKIKISDKFITAENKKSRAFYLIKCFLRGMLW